LRESIEDFMADRRRAKALRDLPFIVGARMCLELKDIRPERRSTRIREFGNSVPPAEGLEASQRG